MLKISQETLDEASRLRDEHEKNQDDSSVLVDNLRDAIETEIANTSDTDKLNKLYNWMAETLPNCYIKFSIMQKIRDKERKL